MDNDTVFYVLGGVLVAAALITSFLGLRFERFPGSRPLQLAGIALFVVLVGAATTFAWRNGEDEQATRQAEQASGELPTPAETAAAMASGQVEGTGEGQQPTTTTGGETTTTAAAADGQKLFDSQGCSGCHTLTAAGASGTTGPDLDTVLKGKSAAFIETSIVDPNAEVEKGYPPDVMPQTFEQSLSPEELDALVQYLLKSTQ